MLLEGNLDSFKVHLLEKILMQIIGDKTTID